MSNIRNVELREDGSLYFVAEAEPDSSGCLGRFMECVVKYEDSKFILRANDWIVAEF